MNSPVQPQSPFSEIILVGAGVVGSAIAQAHIKASLGFVWTDANQDALVRSVDYLTLNNPSLSATPCNPPVPKLFAFRLDSIQSPSPNVGTPEVTVLVIESIVEKLDAKKLLVRQLFENLGPRAIFASNTSSLRIQDIAAAAPHPDRVCGMHFFMPVHQRPLVEIVTTDTTSQTTQGLVVDHGMALGKQSLRVKDSPGFVVNRMLWPYLNQAVAMLGAGIDHSQIREAATRFGMPMSPLELIDWIGLRTAFDSGRIAWQAFPKRIEPSPILPGMLKAGLTGRSGGVGFYRYENSSTDPIAPDQLSEAASTIIQKYQGEPARWNDNQVYLNLVIPIWIEAALILKERLAKNGAEIELALSGGLGFSHPDGFWDQIRSLVPADFLECTSTWSTRFKALSAPQGLVTELASATNPVLAIERWLSLPHRD